MIQTRGVVGHGLLRGVLPVEVEVHQRIVGRRRKRRGGIKRLGQRTNARQRDLVVVERRAHVVVVAALRRIRIVQLLQHAGAINQSAEIARAHRQRRHAHQLLARPAQRKALESDEEERLVAAVVKFGNQHRPAHGKTELVADQRRRLEIGWILPGAGDAEVVVARRVEQRAVHGVGARLGGEDYRGGRGKLRARIHRLKAGFLHRIRIRQRGLRRVALAAEVPIRHRRSILRILHAFLHQAVGARAITFQPRHRVLRQPQYIAAVHGQLANARGVQLRVHRAAVVGGQLHRLARHGNKFRHIADGQLGVEDQVLSVL